MIHRILICLIGVLGLVLGSIGSVSANGTVVVGGKKFTEQQLVAEMTAQLLRANGYSVDKRPDLGSSILRAALENGQVDVYWEYTGTSPGAVQQGHRHPECRRDLQPGQCP